MKRVEVVAWSDFVCPWCWIAKRRLEQAIKVVEKEVEVVVEFKAYRLAKGMRPTDFSTAL
ncbi:DsbA family protein, partial [Paraburkholderia sp. J63]|uniref:DsbA family protein n=1 Tax=Paraburkholderia sp. J63 TaxID=2805434 RepID=UPI002ABE5C8F